MDDPPFPQWKSATLFNKVIATSVHHYVLLIPKTDTFQIYPDLQRTLNITKRPLLWFAHLFRKHGVQVEYGTIFLQRDLRLLGPLATTVSNAIVRCYLQSRYSRSVVLVCPASLAKQVPFQAIDPETLVLRITAG